MLPSLSRLTSVFRRLASPPPAHGPWRIDHLVLPVDDTHLLALLSERNEIAFGAEQVEGMVIALAGASPDLAIALWERFRAWDRANWRQPLPMSAGAAPVDSGAAINNGGDPLGDPIALGAWRAAMALHRLRRLALTVHGVPSEVMLRTAAMARGHEALLRDGVDARARAWLDAWAVEAGEAFEVDLVHVRHGQTGITLEAAIRRPA